jgi:predicted DNA-binding protein (MmcQ/YjbR family)
MMDRSDLRAHCLSKTAAVEEFPFGQEVSVFKVMGKMFALVPVDGPVTISLKCDPTLAMLLRDTFTAVTPGYHLNKWHWNTVTVDGSVPDDQVRAMIDHSYELVVKGLTKAQRQALDQPQP